MKNLLIGLIIGSAIGGIWVQYRITGDIWSNKSLDDIKTEAIIGYETYLCETKNWERYCVSCVKPN